MTKTIKHPTGRVPGKVAGAPCPATATTPEGRQAQPGDGAEGKLDMPDLLTLALWALLERREREGG